jgi:uncharacterized protein YxjI
MVIYKFYSVYHSKVITNNKFINKYSILGSMNALQKTIAIASVLATMYGCRQTTNSLPSDTIHSKYEQKLEHAKEILISEKLFCLGKQYRIYVDNEKVATVKGRNWNWWTDKFVLKTTDGKILESESENKKILTFNRSASFYDGDGNINGYIAEHTGRDLLNWNHLFHIYDAEQREVGVTEKKRLTILDKIVLYDMQGNTDYIAHKKIKLLRDKYVITVADTASVIPVEKIIMLTCIEDAIKDSKESKSSKSKSSDNN